MKRNVKTTLSILLVFITISICGSCKKDDTQPTVSEKVLTGMIVSNDNTLKKGETPDTINIVMSTNEKLIYSFELTSIDQTTTFTYNDDDQLTLAENNHGEYMHFNFTEDTIWFEIKTYYWTGTDSLEEYYYYYITNNTSTRYLNPDNPKDIFLQYKTYDDSIQFYVKDFNTEELKLKATRYFTFSDTKNPLKNKIDRTIWMCLDEIIDFIPIRNTDYIISAQAIHIWETGEDIYYTYEEVFNDTGLLLQITYDNKVYEFLYK